MERLERNSRTASIYEAFPTNKIETPYLVSNVSVIIMGYWLSFPKVLIFTDLVEDVSVQFRTDASVKIFPCETPSHHKERQSSERCETLSHKRFVPCV